MNIRGAFFIYAQKETGFSEGRKITLQASDGMGTRL